MVMMEPQLIFFRCDAPAGYAQYHPTYSMGGRIPHGIRSGRPYKSIFWLSYSWSAGSIYPRRVCTRRVFLKFWLFCIFLYFLSKTIVFLYKSTLGIAESSFSMKLPHLWYWRNDFLWFLNDFLKVGRSGGRTGGIFDPTLAARSPGGCRPRTPAPL